MEHDVGDLYRQLGRLEAENIMLLERNREHRATIVHLVSLNPANANPKHGGTRAALRDMQAMQEGLNGLGQRFQQIETELEQCKKDSAAGLDTAQRLSEEYKAASTAAFAELEQAKKDAAALVEAARTELQDYKKTSSAEITAAHMQIEQLMKTAAEASKMKVTSWLDQVDETPAVDFLGLYSGAICHKPEPATAQKNDLSSAEPYSSVLVFRNSDGKKRHIPGDGDMPSIVPDGIHRSHRGGNAFKVPFHLQQRLLNAAVFTETLEGEELDNHWNLFADDNKRYTKEQWQTYYQRVIRPMYLDKQTAATTATPPADFPVTDKDIAPGSPVTDKKDTVAATAISPAGSPVTDKVTAAAKAIPPAKSGVNDKKDVGNSTTLHASAEASFHTVSLIDSADLSPQDTVDTPSSVKILYGDKQIDLEYMDKPVDQIHSNVTSMIIATPEASYAGPSLLGTDEQLAEARSFLQAATKGRRRGDKKPRRSAEIDSSGEFGMASSMHTPEPSVLHDDNFGGYTAVEVAGLPAALLAHDVVICLKPRGMISGQFVKTAGMKTIPPITTNTFIAVFPTNSITYAFCAKKEDKERRLADLANVEVKLVFRQLPNDSQIMNRRFQGLVDRGVTSSLLVEVTETDWAKMDLLDAVRKHSHTAITTLSITDSWDKRSVLIIFNDILMAWTAYNILKDFAELESCFIDPWANADKESMPEDMDAVFETTSEEAEDLLEDETSAP